MPNDYEPTEASRRGEAYAANQEARGSGMGLADPPAYENSAEFHKGMAFYRYYTGMNKAIWANING